MRRLTREGESVVGRGPQGSTQALGIKQYQMSEEEEGEEENMEGCEQPRYIPIRRHSRFYTSMRARKIRRDRGSGRDSMEIETQNPGLQGYKDQRNSLTAGNSGQGYEDPRNSLKAGNSGQQEYRDPRNSLIAGNSGPQGYEDPRNSLKAGNSGQQRYRDPRNSLIPRGQQEYRHLRNSPIESNVSKNREYSHNEDSSNPPADTPSTPESTSTSTEALPAVYPAPADSWKTLIGHVEFLYQEYRDKSTQNEIEARRLQDIYVQSPKTPDSPKSPEEGSSPPTEHTRSNSTFSRLQNTCSGFNLWQDLPEIKNSCVLSVLQPQEIKLQEAMFELVTSEASYHKSLSLLVSHFMESDRLKATIHSSEMHFIFSNVLEVLSTSERFLLDLEQRFEENLVISDVCDIVFNHAENHFGVYVTYVCNQTYQERAYRKLLQERTEFREAVAHLETNPICRGLPFSSFLILPFQRITRLKLLVQNILTKVEEGSNREASALQAHRELEKLVRACNDGVRKMSRTEQLISIEKTLEFKIKSVPIISHSRWLLKQGELQQMSGPRTSRTLRTKKLFRSVYLFLFNDLLLLCKRQPGDRYQVFDVAARGLLRVEELEDQGQSLANVFILKLLENAHEREFTYMLKASSQSEMKRWMTSLVPNRRTKFVSITARVFDCPQVQCVHPYIAQEPDELSLDLADLLNVLDKTDDGWVFGERLHDQERGWFPSTVTEEILNKHVRTQNLKECFRVHKTDEGSQNKDRRKMGSRTRQ
ncbi:ephexin-1 isoform 2-T3 [Anomaloglossus baeobatrachus]|uniref:ephexin-1 isoform X2 n=1 Tax=Anomaloglossus baeobatrachus TaxID=238106 RepID=UPI003F4FBAB9